MKHVISSFLAALSAVVLTLVLYDQLIVKPRAAVLAGAIAQQFESVKKTAKIDLSSAQRQAETISQTLDASVKKSVADAQSALDSQVSEQEQRRLMGLAMLSVSTLKTIVAESYSNSLTFPETAKAMGAGAPADYANEAVSGVALGAKGVLIISLKPNVAAGGKIRFIPTINASTSAMSWRCVGENVPNLVRFQPVCE